ncbi:MAG: tRNA 2-thiouridine(34) synthase MnmA [bacterium]
MVATPDLTIAVGLSGGVDSSVAAYLLQKQGHHVIGLTMQIWDGSLPLTDEGLSGCYGPGEPRDIAAAKALADRLGIPHHVISLAPEYNTEVLDYFRAEYRAGRTPNPCVRCNRTMKFGMLLDRARAMGITFDKFATGHYARVGQDPATGRWQLRRSVDPAKDQTYFLSRLSQAQLSQVLFPLGGMTKPEVKAIAREIGWDDVADKPESQNFIESKDYGVLFGEQEQEPGPLVDTQGKVLGQHCGIIHYTIGQRKGLGIGGTVDPLYVVRIDACANTVVVGAYSELFSTRLLATDLNWIGLPAAPARPLRVQAKIRQQHKEATAVIQAVAGTDTVDTLFDEQQMSITPGQVVVLYQDDLVLGSGIIGAG